MQKGIRDTITTISTKDLALRQRRDLVKEKFNVTDEQIFVEGVKHFESKINGQ